MQIAVRIGRAIMKNIFWSPGRVVAQSFVKVHFLPARDYFRLLFRKPGPHGKFCFWQIQSVGIVAGAGLLVRHVRFISFSAVMFHNRVGPFLAGWKLYLEKLLVSVQARGRPSRPFALPDLGYCADRANNSAR